MPLNFQHRNQKHARRSSGREQGGEKRSEGMTSKMLDASAAGSECRGQDTSVVQVSDKTQVRRARPFLPMGRRTRGRDASGGRTDGGWGRESCQRRGAGERWCHNRDWPRKGREIDQRQRVTSERRGGRATYRIRGKEEDLKEWGG